MNKLLSWVLSLALLILSASAAQTDQPAASEQRKDLTEEQAGKITMWVGNILEQAHYKHSILDDTISEMFLKNYLDALDYNHMIFLQSDVDEITKKYGKELDNATLKGDVSPAFDIFKQYLERLKDADERAKRLLQEKYDFTRDESFTPSRTKSPWPADNNEAEKLWRLRIKFELLQDHLAFLEREAKKEEEKKNEKPGANAAKPDDGQKHNPEETLKTIAKRYDRLLRTMKDFTNEEILQVYLSSLSHTYDPHSDYQSATEAEEFEIKSITLKLSGIGATLQSEDGYTKIVQLVQGAPAMKSKQLKVGDRIVAVAQAEGEPVDVVEMPLNKVVKLIRGPRGTEVRLTVLPADTSESKKIVPIIRDEIKIADQFAKGRLIEHPDASGKLQRLGVVDLPGFYDNCSQDVAKIIERLKQENISGLVLDLRRNGGGILEEAVNLTGLFIPKGPVVQVKDSNPRHPTQPYADMDGKVAYDGPLIVLVSKLSASASEITAAALQDHGRAILVGDQTTHGKGTVQKLWPLSSVMSDPGVNPGKLKLTVAKFYRIAGSTTQMIGVTPDVILPSRYDYLELGEAHLPNCLPADNTTPLVYLKQDRVSPYLADLRKNSASRIKTNQDFIYLNEDIELLKKQLLDKSISLNEAVRLHERDEIKSREETRKKERAKRKPTQDRIYELTLKMIEENKPLVLAKATKGDDADKSSLTPGDASADDADDDLDQEASPTKLDLYTSETLNILNDYRDLLNKANSKLVSERASAATPVQ